METRQILQLALQMSYDWNSELLNDLRDEPLAQPTANGGNHATWLVGHAICSRGGLMQMIRGDESPYAKWDHLFQGGTEPQTDPTIYPAYDELLEAYRDIHHKSLNALETTPSTQFDQAPEAVPESYREFPDFESVGRLLLFIAMHEMSHRGQLADIRKSLGRKPFG